MAKLKIPKPEQTDESELSKFQLFYEAVPLPEYLEKTIKAPSPPPSGKSDFRTRRISRNRKV